jgi:hypothetical protein
MLELKLFEPRSRWIPDYMERRDGTPALVCAGKAYYRPKRPYFFRENLVRNGSLGVGSSCPRDPDSALELSCAPAHPPLATNTSHRLDQWQRLAQLQR